MKLKINALQGAGTHIVPINAAVQMRCTNVGTLKDNITIELYDELDTQIGVAGKFELEPNESYELKTFCEAGQKIKVSANSTHTLFSKLQETTVGKGSYSHSVKKYKGDGTIKEFLVGENAPANNFLEVSVVIDRFYICEYVKEWLFDTTRSRVVFVKPPYAGADIEIRLFKLE
ncbi:hypothetical protein [Campylobacter fetus]|uniref:hypothetical protein n=1 Tax=Campylobacter fetus TaxID=196 RepID=UPI00138E14FC|nr:hypothetical protein [Campylobacter fetus]